MVCDKVQPERVEEYEELVRARLDGDSREH
jgi:hypothetical protein